MLKVFKYTKAGGDTSIRTVYPLNIVGDDKLLCVDLSEYDETEKEEFQSILEAIHNEYIQAIKNVGLGSNFRTFFLDKISNI